MHICTAARTLVQFSPTRKLRSITSWRSIWVHRHRLVSSAATKKPKATAKNNLKPPEPGIFKLDTQYETRLGLVEKDIQDIKISLQLGMASVIATAAIGISIGSIMLNRRDMMIQSRFDAIGRQLGRLFDQIKTIEGSVGLVGESVGAVGESVGAVGQSVEKSVRGQLGAVEDKVDTLQHGVHGVEKHLEQKGHLI